jgi:ribonuclease HI
MWVTCYTDASYSPGRGGAWAAWLRSERGRVVRHGRCPAYVKDSNAAELAAIYAGVFLAVRTWGSEVGGVLVCSDSQGALSLASREHPLSRKAANRRLQERLRHLAIERDLALDLRWVRGHQPLRSSTGAYLNGWCDRLARKARVSGTVRLF